MLNTEIAREEVHKYRVGVEKLAEVMKDMKPLDCQPEHLFAPGLYVRILRMPAGSLIISKIHKTEHFCLALNGMVTVVKGAGDNEIVIGPSLMLTMPGTQRALYIHKDATWITFHPTDKTDVDEIESEIIAKDWNDPALITLKDQKRIIGETS